MCVILPDRGITKIAETILVSAIFVIPLSAKIGQVGHFGCCFAYRCIVWGMTRCGNRHRCVYVHSVILKLVKAINYFRIITNFVTIIIDVRYE